MLTSFPVFLPACSCFRCVPQSADGDNADVLWSWAYHNTGGRYQTEDVYPYNRTCNFFREQQHAPDGTNDGYPGTCNLPGKQAEGKQPAYTCCTARSHAIV